MTDISSEVHLMSWGCVLTSYFQSPRAARIQQKEVVVVKYLRGRERLLITLEVNDRFQCSLTSIPSSTLRYTSSHIWVVGQVWHQEMSDLIEETLRLQLLGRDRPDDRWKTGRYTDSDGAPHSRYVEGESSKSFNEIRECNDRVPCKVCSKVWEACILSVC